MSCIVHRDNVQRSTMTTFFSRFPAEVWGARGSDPPRRRGASCRVRGKPWSLHSAPGGAHTSPVARTPFPWTSPRLTVHSVCVTGPSHGEYHNKPNGREIETNWERNTAGWVTSSAHYSGWSWELIPYASLQVYNQFSPLLVFFSQH